MKVDASSDADEEPEGITDTDGLKSAYSSPNRLYRNRDTLYVAGAIDFSDVTDD